MVNDKLTIIRHLQVILILFLTAWTGITQAQPIATIDRSVIAIDDTLTFTIRSYESGAFSSPDLTPLEKDFQIVGNNKSSRYVSRNGKAESWTEWTISLIPKRKGNLTIPPITVAGETTSSLTVAVQPSVPVSSGAIRPVFLESEVDNESVYVQQQIIYTIKIFQSIQLDNMNISEPEFENAVVEKLEQNSFQRRINNIPYRVYELRYAIFPQETGEFIIPEIVFTANETVARRSMFSLPNQGKIVRKMTQQHSVQVLSPANTSGTWLPAQSLSLEETWSDELTNIRVGDSITRSITVKADGLLSSQLPPYEFRPINNVKFYPDKGTTENVITDKGIVSARTDSAAIIPTQAGKLVLPEIKVQWWNTEKRQREVAVVPEKTISVLPALASNQSTATPLAVDHSSASETSAEKNAAPTTEQTIADSKNTIWQWLTFIFAIAWLITLGFLLTIKNKPENKKDITALDTNHSEKQAFKILASCCNSNDPIKTREAITQWAKSYYRNDAIQSFSDIKRLINEPTINNQLNLLDSIMYSENNKATWQGKDLINAINAYKQQQKEKGNSDQLRPLYQH